MKYTTKIYLLIIKRFCNNTVTKNLIGFGLMQDAIKKSGRLFHLQNQKIKLGFFMITNNNSINNFINIIFFKL